MNEQELRDIISKFNKYEKHRYASFDFVYNYFRLSSSDEMVKNMQLSTSLLWSYLASWGMLRGSSFLFKNENWAYLKDAVIYISKQDKSVWSLDVDTWNDTNINILLKKYDELKEIIVPNGNAHLVLITKIMMGVFGIIPAYDRFFTDTFKNLYPEEKKVRFTVFNRDSLERIKLFYDKNKAIIDELSRTACTIDFETETNSNINYTKSKIIDMYGFVKGLEAEEEKKAKAKKAKDETQSI